MVMAFLNRVDILHEFKCAALRERHKAGVVTET